MDDRPTLAVWKFASCDGCQLTLLDCEDELLAIADRVRIAHFLEASSATIEGPYDISLVEGSVTTPSDVERIRRVREQSKFLVTIGACACAGGIQALRNFADVDEFRSIVYARPEYIQTLATSMPIGALVKVDLELRGCPIDRGQLLDTLSALLIGRHPDLPGHSVCFQCKARGITCLRVLGQTCLGPVTHARLPRVPQRRRTGPRGPIHRGAWARVKKAGNTILQTIGGRAIHPINVRVGGFYRAPDRAELQALRPMLRQALADALATVQWVASFDFPDFTIEHELLALVEPGRYAIETGLPTTDRGLTFPVAEFERYIIEEQVPHSTALHAHLAGRDRYLTGPLARYALSRRWLTPLARDAATAAGLGDACRNPFRSIVVRAVELVYAVQEALRLINTYQPGPSDEPVGAYGGIGCGATEAPRGTLFHRYEMAPDGTIATARIIPPTSQNQAAIEDDLRQFVQTRLDLDDHRLTHECEQAIRNYDPCISCATHFLDLTIERS